jgi:AcrR family transcriptional regulator
MGREGETEIHIERLVARLGVTKGSFYWHFENREDFIRQVADYWATEFTGQITRHLESLEASASEKLLTLMRAVIGQELARYDLVMRTWATHDKGVARVVRKVDRKRFSTVRGLFAAIGFDGDELERRTNLFVTFMSFESNLGVSRSKRQRLEDLPALHALLTSTRLP